MKVRANATYRYSPCILDSHLDPKSDAKSGDIVRVVNLPMAPKANTMGQCHIETLDGKFLGMVSTNSLFPKNAPITLSDGVVLKTQLDTALHIRFAMRNIGISTVAIDDDEWAWAVVERPDTQTHWGSGCTVLANGCELSVIEAVSRIYTTLKNLDIDPKSVVELPF